MLCQKCLSASCCCLNREDRGAIWAEFLCFAAVNFIVGMIIALSFRFPPSPSLLASYAITSMGYLGYLLYGIPRLYRVLIASSNRKKGI